MESNLVLLTHLLILTFFGGTGLKISSRLSFDGNEKVTDLIKHDYNQSEKEDTGTTEFKNYEAQIPLVLGKNKNGYEIKIPFTAARERTTESENKINIYSGFNLFERRSTTKEVEKTTPKTVPVVKGSVLYVKPDFLIPIPQQRPTTSPHPREVYTFENFWPEKDTNKENEIEGLKPPAPVDNQWILNRTPFLSFPRNATTFPPIAPTLNVDKLGDPSAWNVLESGSWNPRDPLSWNKNRKTFWILRRPGWNHNYSTRNVRYSGFPAISSNGYYPGQKFPHRGRWISCPPFEVNDIGPSERQFVPGCPQNPSNPPDVEFINVTPVTAIDDKTSFKEFVGKPDVPPEEPKVAE